MGFTPKQSSPNHSSPLLSSLNPNQQKFKIMAHCRSQSTTTTFRRSRVPRTPRELASHTQKLAREKLQQDETKHSYDVRERLLLYRTIARCEQVMCEVQVTKVVQDEDDEDECEKANTATATEAIAKPEKVVCSLVAEPLQCLPKVEKDVRKDQKNFVVALPSQRWVLALPLIPLVAVLITRTIMSRSS